MQLTTPPQNIDAEESVIAGCLMFPEFASGFAGLIKPDDFYRTQNGVIFAEICKLVEKRQQVDALIICDRLKDAIFPGDLGIAQYIAEVSTAPVPSNAEHYAGIIKDASTSRKTIQTCQKAISDLSSGEPIAEVINKLQSSTLDLGADSADKFYTMEDLAHSSIERYEAMRKQAISEKRIKTGFHLLDHLTGGISGSKLIIIAARPGVGKTAFMCNLIENMAKARRRCGVFELEMDKEELEDRWFSSLSGINSARLTSSQELTRGEWDDISRVAAAKASWPVILDDTGGLTIAEIKRRCRKMKSMGAEIIFIDQLSKIKGNRKLDIFERNTEHVEELGSLKKELRIPIVLLAQLNRDLEKRPIHERKPRLSDLKNTGQLEEEGDMVLLGYRPWLYSQKPEDEPKAEWELAKHRGGPISNMEMVWVAKHARFENIAKEEWSGKYQ